MKQTLLGLFFLFLFAGLSAQRFSLVNPVDAPIILDLDEEKGFMQADLQLINSSKDTLHLKVSELQSSLADGHRTQFCFSDDCNSVGKGQLLVLLPEDTLSYRVQTNVQEEVNGGYFLFDPAEQSGESEVSLRFEDIRGSGVGQDVSFHFAAHGQSPSQVPVTATFSSPYPNPAERVAYLDYRLPEGVTKSYIRIVNLIGRDVQRVPLEHTFGTATLLTDQLPSGVYFVYLIGDGEELGTRKLVVSK